MDEKMCLELTDKREILLLSIIMDFLWYVHNIMIIYIQTQALNDVAGG